MVFISPYEDDYVFDYVEAPIKADGDYLFKMNVYHSGGYTIGVSQKDKRCLPLSCEYDYARSVHIKVILETEKDKKKVYTPVKEEKKSWERDVYVPFDKLKKGTYWILVKVKWDNFDKFQNDLTLTLNSYGCTHVVIAHDDDTDKSKF